MTTGGGGTAVAAAARRCCCHRAKLWSRGANEKADYCCKLPGFSTWAPLSSNRAELGKKIINENHPLCASIKLSSPRIAYPHSTIILYSIWTWTLQQNKSCQVLHKKKRQSIIISRPGSWMVWPEFNGFRSKGIFFKRRSTFVRDDISITVRKTGLKSDPFWSRCFKKNIWS